MCLHLKLLEFAEVSAAPNLSQAEQRQSAGNLVIALHGAEQSFDCGGGLAGPSSHAQHRYALGAVVLGCLAYLPVLASLEQC